MKNDKIEKGEKEKKGRDTGEHGRHQTKERDKHGNNSGKLKEVLYHHRGCGQR